MLTLDGVTKRFDDAVAVDDVTLVVPEGQTLALLGPSGCGKSTLLRLIVGLLRPDAGVILFDGQPITDGPDLLKARRRFGYVIQDGGLFPHLTGRDNVVLLARQVGWSPSRIADRLEELRELTRLPADNLDRYPSQLSGGQRQRLALMRGLMLDPAVLLLDEPMGALDPMIRADLQGDLRRIIRSLNKTVLLVTHDLGEAAYLSDRMVLLRRGRIVQEGTDADFAERPADPFVTAFRQAQRPPAV